MVSVLGLVIAGGLAFAAYNLYYRGQFWGEAPAVKKTKDFLAKTDAPINASTQVILQQEAKLETLEATATDKENEKVFSEKKFVEIVTPLVPKTMRDKS